jgi:hypothetical protein
MANQRKRSFKPSVERGEVSKLLSAILIGIGFLALLAIMWMTGRFGWSLQKDQADRYAQRHHPRARRRQRGREVRG